MIRTSPIMILLPLTSLLNWYRLPMQNDDLIRDKACVMIETDGSCKLHLSQFKETNC